MMSRDASDTTCQYLREKIMLNCSKQQQRPRSRSNKMKCKDCIYCKSPANLGDFTTDLKCKLTGKWHKPTDLCDVNGLRNKSLYRKILQLEKQLEDANSIPHCGQCGQDVDDPDVHGGYCSRECMVASEGGIGISEVGR